MFIDVSPVAWWVARDSAAETSLKLSGFVFAALRKTALALPRHRRAITACVTVLPCFLHVAYMRAVSSVVQLMRRTVSLGFIVAL